jgi:nucleoside-diphosphate-sugar epimerase
VLSDKKILITGASGQVAGPIAAALAADNEVWCLARFMNPFARADLERQGMTCVSWSLGSDDFSEVPDDFTHVIHAAADIFASDWDEAIAANAEGTGLLMTHCRRAEAFLYVSSMAVYKAHPDPWHAYHEGDALGAETPFSPTYSIGKVATEAVVRTLARQLDLPSTIVRLNMAYGTSGHGGLPAVFFDMIRAGRPVPHVPTRQNVGSPIHEQDLIDQVEPLMAAASVPATIVNWAGDEVVEDVELYRYLGELAGVEPVIEEASDQLYPLQVADVTRRLAMTGPTRVGWRDGVRASLAARHPDLGLLG